MPRRHGANWSQRVGGPALAGTDPGQRRPEGSRRSAAPAGGLATAGLGARRRRPRSLAVALATLLPAFLLSGCADSWLVGYSAETNFLTFDHPNSEKAATEVRAEAERLCQQRRQVATRTESVCSLTQCATTYQCEDKVDMIKNGA